jgi:molybdopterin/thiamine biosynthesis adenylyltransferase
MKESNPVIPLDNRNLRQRDIVPAERLAQCHALVIGAGAIGRQVALQLAAVGVPRLTLYDDDKVQVENLAPQGYWVEDLDTAKVYSTTALCRRIHPQIEVTAAAERFKRSSARTLSADPRLVVFLCVPSSSMAA